MTDSSAPVLTADQMAVLASPLRVEIMDSLLVQGAASVPELTVRLEAPLKTLYYHMRQLLAAGLVRVQEVRRVGKRDESVYESTMVRLRIAPGTDLAYTEHMIRWTSAVLRLVDREHQRAIRTIATSQSPGEQPALGAFRSVFHLDPEARTQFLALLEQARQFAQEHNKPGQGAPLSFTAFALPLAPRPVPSDLETEASEEPT